MDIETSYNENLSTLAYANVTKGDYPDPTPTLEVEIQAKRDEITAYKNGSVERPQPKSAYIELLSQLNSELDELISSNENIIADNKSAKLAVDTQYLVDIETYKANSDNQWVAFETTVDEVLRQSEWMLLNDSRLTDDQIIIAKAYRASIMNLKMTYESVADAIENFPTNPYNGVW